MDNQIYAFQFHLETTEASASALLQHCGENLDNSAYVQSADEIAGDKTKFAAVNKAMSAVFTQILI